MQNGRDLADDIYERIFMDGNCGILIDSSIKCVPRVPINNKPALVQIMVWYRKEAKPLYIPMLA